MENRTEHFLEEKIYCHTYDGLVREMASAMEVDSKKLFPNTEGEFDHEDIESWIGAVKFKEGKVPDIQASLSSDRGLNVIKFDVADQKGIGSLDEKATKEELVYSMALTEAKMKVVSDIAEEVYPAVAFQIKDYKREIEKVREEILGDKRENTSLDEVIHGVLSKKTLAAAVIIGGMVLSACGISVEIVTPNATATETQPRVTETVDIGITETPFQPGVTETAPGVSETPTLEVTPTTEATATQEVAPVEQKRILLSEKIEYSGYQFDLEFSMLESDKITKSTFDKYGVESLLFNENKPGARELLAKATIYTFLDTYNFQNKMNVSLDEYVANPGNYPAKIMLRDDEGKIAEQTLTIDQVKSIEMRYTSGLDGELYMNFPGQTTISSGYGFDDGKFIMYSGLGVRLSFIDENLFLKEDEPEAFSLIEGYAFAGINLRNALGMMPYTSFRLVERKGNQDLDKDSIFFDFDVRTETLRPRGTTTTLEESLLWIKTHYIFAAKNK